MKIDTHVHFWKYNPVIHTWINNDMKAIQQNYSPADVEPLLQQHAMDGCIAVQVDQHESETNFLLALSNKNNFIKGIVGWVDLCATNISERLEYFSQYKIIKGYRHIAESEQADFLLRKDFCNGIHALKQNGLTYDLLIRPAQYKAATEFLHTFSEQPIVVDHLAKPDIVKGDFIAWKNNLVAMAKYPAVYCKVSGMVTQTNWHGWKKEDFRKYMDTVVAAFGIERIMFGSDWPVCLLAADYNDVYEIAAHYFNQFSAQEQSLFWGLNAAKFYNI